MLQNPNLKALDKLIEEYCLEKKIFGMMRITVKDKIVFKKTIGYADFATKEPFFSASAGESIGS